MNGVKQGDSLACLFFNLALQKVIRDSGIQTRGTLFYKVVQLPAFADDIDIAGRSEGDIKKSFIVLKTAADAMGLKVNEEKTKTKCIIVTGNRKQITVKPYIKIMEYKFEYVDLYTWAH
jgi:hypothetical protein